MSTFLLLFLAWFSSCGFALSITPALKQHMFDFQFPVNGEAIMLNCNGEDELCAASIQVIGWLRSAKINEIENSYIIQYSANGINASDAHVVIGYGSSTVKVNINVMLPKETIYIAVDTMIFHQRSEVLVHHYHADLVAMRPSDFGLQNAVNTAALSLMSELDHFIDFVEIGTSNFDTCTQQAQSLLVSGAIDKVRGVAVEATQQYLQALPVVPGVVKLHAAITNNPQEEAVSVYYVPESVVDKVRVFCTFAGSFDVILL